MPASPDDLFAYLDQLGLAHDTRWHEATFTVEEGRELKETMPGGHTKNLFMKVKDGVIVLVSAHADSELKLNQLHKLIGTRRLSFASGELMEELLGVTPGSVTAFALMNDKAGKVRFIADAALMAYDTLNFHPLVNTGTTAISNSDFRRFVEATGHDLTVVDFAALLPDA
jgi:Ala-tRNA(Pro) deacylase|tara:strand:+ start:396 stop:905 length:510 start_codon:yes stop_codon:yes gene_type:complete